jgi:hypothetical protein
MKYNKIGFKEAVAEVRKYRPTVLPNLGFERQLKKYEETIRRPRLTDKSKTMEEKKTESGHQILMKTQIMPNF